MARKIVVTSGKGGVGKTTVCANLGARLASLGFRVAILDVDIGLNNLDVVMGIENKIVFDIVDVIEGRCRAKQALVQDSRYVSLYIMPSSHAYHKANITGENILRVVSDINDNFDYILIDCPAGVEAGFHRAVTPANEALVVVTPHISSIRDADKVLSILASYNLSSIGLIINRVRGDLIMNSESIDVEEIVRFLKVPVMGVIPEDDTVMLESNLGGLGGNVSGRAWTLLAENVHNGTKKVYDCTSNYRGFWGMLKRTIKRRV